MLILEQSWYPNLRGGLRRREQLRSSQGRRSIKRTHVLGGEFLEGLREGRLVG